MTRMSNCGRREYLMKTLKAHCNSEINQKLTIVSKDWSSTEFLKDCEFFSYKSSQIYVITTCKQNRRNSCLIYWSFFLKDFLGKPDLQPFELNTLLISWLLELIELSNDTLVFFFHFAFVSIWLGQRLLQRCLRTMSRLPLSLRGS